MTGPAKRGTGTPPSHLLFLDESGDHTMQYAGREAPQPPEIFLLCGCLFDIKSYTDFIPTLQTFKQQYLGRMDEPLVSSSIRWRRPPFLFLNDDALRCQFYADIGRVIREARFTVFAVAIDKYRHWSRYRDSAVSPYHLSLAFLMERVRMSVSAPAGRVRAIAECRGRREDNALRLEYARLLQHGTGYVSDERLRDCFVPPLECRPKAANIPGLQLADLVAYPLANRLCYPAARRKDFEIVYSKLYRGEKGVWGAGLKVFPGARAADYGL